MEIISVLGPTRTNVHSYHLHDLVPHASFRVWIDIHSDDPPVPGSDDEWTTASPTDSLHGTHDVEKTSGPLRSTTAIPSGLVTSGSTHGVDSPVNVDDWDEVFDSLMEDIAKKGPSQIHLKPFKVKVASDGKSRSLSHARAFSTR